MIVIDNNYMINERGIDIHTKLNKKDNASNITDIFFKQLSNRVYDYVMNNSINFETEEQIDNYLNQSTSKVDNFKRALSEQAIYILSVGDTNLMLPDESARWIGLDGWFKLGMSQATIAILNRLGLLEKSAVMW